MAAVLVTGAAGFVGRTTVRAFLRAGWRVRAAARRVPEDAEASAEWRATGDIEAPEAWAHLADGMDCIVHLAARVHVLRETASDPLARFRAVNVEATVRLAEEAARAGVRRFLLLSSIGVNGAYTDERPFRETDAPQPHNAYAQSKWEAEQALQRIARTASYDYTILRAPLVYGPDAPGNFSRLAGAIRNGWPLPFGCVRNQRSVLFVENLAQAIVHCAQHPGAANQTFMVADDHAISTPALIAAMGRALGVAPRLWRMPLWMLRGLMAAAGSRLPRARLLDSLAVDASLVRERTGWRPPYGLDEALALTFKVRSRD